MPKATFDGATVQEDRTIRYDLFRVGGGRPFIQTKFEALLFALLTPEAEKRGVAWVKAYFRAPEEALDGNTIAAFTVDLKPRYIREALTYLLRDSGIAGEIGNIEAYVIGHEDEDGWRVNFDEHFKKRVRIEFY